MENKFCNQIQWPQIFTDGELRYTDDREGKLHAIANAFEALGHDLMGCPTPEYFGIGMSKISEFLGIVATRKELTILMNQLMNLQKHKN